jgi:hypothetical protein
MMSQPLVPKPIDQSSRLMRIAVHALCGRSKLNNGRRGINRLLMCFLLMLVFGWAATIAHAAASDAAASTFPRGLNTYSTTPGSSLLQLLTERARTEPFNLVATIIFCLAILHTFLAPRFTRLSHRLELEHKRKLAALGKAVSQPGGRNEVSFVAEICHFLGEIEAIFGIWVIPLLIALTLNKGWLVARNYVGQGLDFTEPLFVVVIMTIAASRPILNLSEKCLSLVAALGKGSTSAWWLTILTLGPLLGSFITEPAGMTISALLLSEKFYAHKPSTRLGYATLGLLFVNVSVGGTLTHFAAPPVLMVASKWNWGLAQMLTLFGWKAIVGILIANLAYWSVFRSELRRLNGDPTAAHTDGRAVRTDSGSVPGWVTLVHVMFLVWTVITSHFPALFIGGFLFYLAFTQATEHHQDELALRPALLVGFFLAGLVVHGGLQGWWIEPVLRGLKETSLFLAAGVLTAFNDNAAITYLASLVPDLGPSLKYAVVAGAVTGGGLTVIANAPNPAGQTILNKFFPDGISPLGLLLGALIPTILIGLIFLIF